MTVRDLSSDAAVDRWLAVRAGWQVKAEVRLTGDSSVAVPVCAAFDSAGATLVPA